MSDVRSTLDSFTALTDRSRTTNPPRTGWRSELFSRFGQITRHIPIEWLLRVYYGMSYAVAAYNTYRSTLDGCAHHSNWPLWSTLDKLSSHSRGRLTRLAAAAQTTLKVNTSAYKQAQFVWAPPASQISNYHGRLSSGWLQRTCCFTRLQIPLLFFTGVCRQTNLAVGSRVPRVCQVLVQPRGILPSEGVRFDSPWLLGSWWVRQASERWCICFHGAC